MGKKVRSAKGEQVDFDLLKIKEQIAAAPAPTDVRARQDFIEKRLRRRLKKVPTPAPKIKSDATVAVDPKLPTTEDLTEEPKLIEETQAEVVDTAEATGDKEKTTKKAPAKKKTTRRQRARPLKPKSEE